MIKVFGATDPGKVRKENQDAFAYRIIAENTAYAIVCDGMGGEKAGDVASSTACQMISKFFQRDISDTISESSMKSILFSAVSAANAKVYSMSKENPGYEGMGTTLVLAAVQGGVMHVVNVGDSRIYLSDGQTATQITRDHTVVQNLIDRGEINEEQASIHPQRHYITRAVGVEDEIDIDYQVIDLEQGSQVLLCSDGLSSYLSLELLPGLLQRCLEEESTQSLIDFANENGGSDNITAVLLCHV